MKLLIDFLGKKYLVKKKGKFSTKHGEVSVDSKNGKTKSHLGKDFYQIDANFSDILNKCKRGPQAVLLKDSALIAAFTGIGKNSKVVDAGTGSGWLAAYLAKIVFPKKIVSYEKRKEFIKIAKKNFELLGIKNVQIKNADVYSELNERNIDLLALDLPEPWKVDILRVKIGGYAVAYLPQMTQVVKFVNFAEEKGFLIEHVIENPIKEWKVKGDIARPKFQQLGHTAFLVFARRVE